MLPAQRIGPDGRPHVDFRAIGALAFPLMLNSGLQVVISLTDTWFVGHISTTRWPASPRSTGSCCSS